LGENPGCVPQEGDPLLPVPNIIGWRPSEQAVRGAWHSKGTTHAYVHPFIEKTFETLTATVDQEKRKQLLGSIGTHLQEEFADIPLFWFANEVFANPKVVGSWTYPGIAAGRSTHFELIRPAE
jgi:ABC-type transport system substrate-binding protein